MVSVCDWRGESYRVGGEAEHWCGRPLEIRLRTEAAGRTLLAQDAMGILEKVLCGEAELEGNLYLLPEIRRHARLSLGLLDTICFLARHLAFQTRSRAQVNIPHQPPFRGSRATSDGTQHRVSLSR